MNTQDALRHMREHTPLNQFRACLSGVIGEAEQAGQQRRPPTPMETRKHEFESAQRLLETAFELGLALPPVHQATESE